MRAMQASGGAHERTLRDLLEAVFRHRKKALLFFLTVVATALVVLAFASGTYTSTAKLMIGRERENVFLKAAAESGEVLPLYKEWENEINSELEILTSRELVSEVVQSLGSDTLLAAPKLSRSGLLSPVRIVLSPVRWLIIKCRNAAAGLSAGKTGGAEPGQTSRAIQTVEKNLKIEVRSKSDIITISYTAASPELARQVVSRLVAIYLDKRIAVRRVPGAHQFFTQQTEQLLRELKDTEESIHTIKSQAGISSLEDSRRALQTSIETVRAQQLQNESALATANSRVATLRTILAQQVPADSVAKGGALLDRTEHQALQATLRSEEITQTALIAGARELDQQLAQLRQELAGMNTLEAPLRKLEREQELLEGKYRKYSEDKEQARINEELETRKISNVSIVQHATLPTKANPSNKLFKLLAALFLGMAGAVAVALGAAWIDPALYSAAEVSERLHLPVLIELPVMPDGDRFQELLFKLLALRASGESGPFVIGVTSSSAGEGVSSIAANLASAFARDDRFANTLLLDASMRDPAGELAEQAEAAPFTYQSINGIRGSAESEGKPGGVAMFIDQLTRVKKQDYDVVVVDLPPASQGCDTARMAGALGLVILVVAAGRTPWRTALRAAERLAGAQAKLCGIILNRKCFAMPEWLYRKL